MQTRQDAPHSASYFLVLEDVDALRLLGRRIRGISGDSAGKFKASDEIGLSGIKVGVDRNEHRVRIALGKLNVTRRDLDHMRTTRIGARLCRCAQIAPANFHLYHLRFPIMQAVASVWLRAATAFHSTSAVT